jgi:hypothetical protein
VLGVADLRLAARNGKESETVTVFAARLLSGLHHKGTPGHFGDKFLGECRAPTHSSGLFFGGGLAKLASNFWMYYQSFLMIEDV